MSERELSEDVAEAPPDDVPDLPKRQLSTYARLWQLEVWLRRMAYLELRASRGDSWTDGIKADNPFKADGRLTHMPTPETDVLSYISFSSLTQQIEKNWPLFSLYLPPQDLWKAKLEEVTQIRNRVAHFRRGHADDHSRVLQLLRDLDAGFWSFCTSYNDSHPVLPADRDAVSAHFLGYDPFPWTQIDGRGWARIGFAPPDMVVSVTVEILRRPWAEKVASVDGAPGYLYDIHLGSRGGRTFDYRGFLNGIAHLNSHFVHICLSNSRDLVRLTVPATLGSQRVIAIVDHALEVAGYTVSRVESPLYGYRSVQEFTDHKPEFILGPQNPLTFLSPDMPCTFFAV